MAIVAIMLALAGCNATPVASPTQAAPCENQYSAARCQIMGATAAGYLGIDPGTVVAVRIVPEPTPETVDGKTILRTYGGAVPILVEVALADGSRHVAGLCGGIPDGPACTNDPHLRVGGVGFDAGYRDVPCADPPAACPTPWPSPDPKSVAAAKPITMKRFDVPIDHVGAYAVPVGVGSLPHGILTSTSFALVDDWPTDVSIADSTVGIEIRSLEPDGKPFQNYYDHGWRPGPERIQAWLIFGVTRFDPGAVLHVRDVVVR